MKRVNGNVLFIDDDNDVLYTARLVLKPFFQKLITINDPEIILEKLSNENFDVIVLDMNFKKGSTSGREGLFWLRKILEFDQDAHVIMNTAYGDITLAIEAMKLGAIDFLVKPWEAEKLLATVLNVFELSQSKKEIDHLKSAKRVLNTEVNQAFTKMISKAKSMDSVFEAIDKVAATDANVLILGENGTGKELVARMIHRKSARYNCDFISVDLGSISESLFESEMFGHVKGAFTDASEDRIGRFEIASKGSLFLDEIGNLSMSLQSKLLTAIQNRTIYRIGSGKPIDVDIRLICATNKPIYQMLVKEEFRQDLLYRINTVEINLPPLRQRIEDIPILVEHFHKQFKKKYNKPNQYVSKKALKLLQQYIWPGNIRELQHVVERAIIMSDDDELCAGSFLLKPENEHKEEITGISFEDVQISAIRKALMNNHGNLTKAAEELKIGRSTLYRKMKKHEL